MKLVNRIPCRVFQLAFRAALPILPYREPVILEDMNAVGALLSKQGKDRVLIITDKTLNALGVINPLYGALTQARIAFTVYDDTVPNPTIENVEEARKQYLEFGAKAIIAFGGGSPMDCAKVTGARIVRPRKPVQKMRGLLKILHRLPLLIAIPTTAGTGSETTLAAVITDGQTHHKYPINDFSLIPHYAVLEEQVTVGLPKQITATTGMDALTHAVEAYIGRSTTAHTRAMAIEAVRLIDEYLLRAYRDGGDLMARRQMLRAAYCAGIAFTQSYVGYVHAVAHSLGGQYGTPHGLANAVLLPYVLEEYGASCEAKLADLARKCGISPASADDTLAAQNFIFWVRDMNERMQIPSKLNGIRKEDIPRMATLAAKEANPLYPVPRLMNAKELERFYHSVADWRSHEH